VGPLSDAGNLRLIRENFVPVAVNLYRLREAKGPEGEFFQKVIKQRQQYQGVWIVSAEGQVYGGHHDFKSHKTWAQEFRRDLNAALQACGEVNPRDVPSHDPLPFRGVGRRPDGSVTLAIAIRHAFNGRPQGAPVLDSVTLSAEDWAAFRPKELSVGATWKLPESVSRRFAGCVSATSDQSTVPRPEEVTAVDLGGRVKAVRGGVALLEYEGTLSANRTYRQKLARGQSRLRGFGHCEVDSGELTSLTWVFEGTFRGFPPYDQPVPVAALVEWSRSERDR
jgi:hypothetical protein